MFSRKIKPSVFGFTLIELLVALGIFSILMAIAVPNLIAAMPAARLNGAARQVLSSLMWTRAKAVKENNQFIVTFPTNTSYTILDDDNNNGIAEVGERTKTQDIQANYVDVTFAKTGVDPIFSPRGIAGGATTITLTNSSGTRTVTVSATGVVKVD